MFSIKPPPPAEKVKNNRRNQNREHKTWNLPQEKKNLHSLGVKGLKIGVVNSPYVSLGVFFSASVNNGGSDTSFTCCVEIGDSK